MLVKAGNTFKDPSFQDQFKPGYGGLQGMANLYDLGRIAERHLYKGRQELTDSLKDVTEAERIIAIYVHHQDQDELKQAIAPMGRLGRSLSPRDYSSFYDMMKPLLDMFDQDPVPTRDQIRGKEPVYSGNQPQPLNTTT